MSTAASTVQPAAISPRRPVPPHIPRPEYVDRPTPEKFTGSEVKDADTIERMRVAGRLAAQARELVGSHVVPGVTTDELDRIGHEFLCDHGAYPSTLGYRGFPKSLVLERQRGRSATASPTAASSRTATSSTSTSPPTSAACTATPTPPSSPGTSTRSRRLLVERTREALDRAIKAVRPGRRINVIGRVIESYARRFGYGVVRDFTGHGIGTAFHSGLVVPHYDDDYFSTEIQAGMTFTIEPMLNLGTHDYDMWDDGWTVVTKDRKRSAQFEHTLLVTETGAEVLTLP